MAKKDITPSRMNSLIERGRGLEGKFKEKTSADLNSTIETPLTEDKTKVSEIDNTQPEVTTVNQPIIVQDEEQQEIINHQSSSIFDGPFKKTSDRLVTMLVPENLRNDLKIISSAFTMSGRKITAQDLLAQAITEFLQNHQPEIKKAKKKLIG